MDGGEKRESGWEKTGKYVESLKTMP